MKGTVIVTVSVHLFTQSPNFHIVITSCGYFPTIEMQGLGPCASQIPAFNSLNLLLLSNDQRNYLCFTVADRFLLLILDLPVSPMTGTFPTVSQY